MAIKGVIPKTKAEQFAGANKLGNATATQRGTVLRGVAVANAAGAPTQAEFNALLASLRTAGVIAT